VTRVRRNARNVCNKVYYANKERKRKNSTRRKLWEIQRKITLNSKKAVETFCALKLEYI
jgi:hypothetical protein